MKLLRTALVLVAGAAAGWLLHHHSPLAPGDPLAGTLVILPFVVAALVEIGSWGRRLGGRAISAPAAWTQGLAGGALLLLLFTRPGLPGPLQEELWIAAFVLWLAFHVARRLLALRPLLGRRRLPERPSVLFFALPAVVYLALLPWSTQQRPPDGDEPWYLLITHSLAYDFDADLTNNYAQEDWRHFIDRPLEPQPGDPVGPGGQLYSRHNALLPLVLALPYRLAGTMGVLAAMALLTAALAWMTLRLGYHYAPERPGEVLAAYALVAFAPPLLLYCYQLWVEVPAALLGMIALDAILSLEARRRAARDPEAGSRHLGPSGMPPPGPKTQDPGPGGRRVALWLRITAALVLLPLVKIRFMLLAAPLVALAWWHAGRPWKPVLILGLILALVGGGILVYNQLLYDNPLKIHRWEEVELYQYPAVEYLAGLVGLFYDAAFGLFACAPLWLLLLPALGLLAARRRRLLLDLVVFVLPYLVIVAPRAEWFGGWSPPFRYALVVLPLLGLGLVPLLAQRRRVGARGLLAGLGALTLLFTLLWVAVPGWTYNFADGRTYLLDHLSRLLGADVARLFPSYVRLRLASWLWPAVTVLLVPTLWWFPRRRLRGAALWGVAAVLAAAAAVPVAAHRLPTRIIELEDPQVVKGGGHLYPDRWVIERPRYRGGWVLREGEALEAPVVAGGGRARLALWAYLVRHRPGPRRLPLEVWVGGERVAMLQLDVPQQWRRLELEEVPWPPGATLRLRVPPPRHPGQPSGVVLDRVELEWR